MFSYQTRYGHLLIPLSDTEVWHTSSTTCHYLFAWSPDTKTYESVGRMFLLTNLDEVKSNLKTREAQLSTRTSELENSKQYLEKNLKESEDNIREMVQQRKEQSDTKAN